MKYTTKHTIKSFHSQSKDYDNIFKFYTAHTDEKPKSIAWLQEIVKQLPSKKQFIDAGAGNGILTKALAPYFSHTIAIEPNSELRQQLQTNCPEISTQPCFIMDANISLAKADFILCSHVFYYVEQTQWLAHIEKLTTWLAPEGVLVLMLQHHASDCMKMQTHFFQRVFNLVAVAQLFKEEEKYQVDVEVMPIDIITPDLVSTYRIAEFMLNLLPAVNLPTRDDVENYIKQYFYPKNQGGYHFSSDQTLVKICQHAKKYSKSN
jgi:SAM-dependent methyltransferase